MVRYGWSLSCSCSWATFEPASQLADFDAAFHHADGDRVLYVWHHNQHDDAWGIAVAIGDLVDDSIVDIENIYRRLRENRQLPQASQKSAIEVIFEASSEIRNSIVYATLIVVLVVVPLFMMSGLEGRLFAPLGWHISSPLLSSLLVSLTFTPVLASFLLPGAPFLAEKREPLLMHWLKSIDRRVLGWTLSRPRAVLAVVSHGDSDMLDATLDGRRVLAAIQRRHSHYKLET